MDCRVRGFSPMRDHAIEVTTADVTRTPSSFDLEPGPGRRVAGVLIDLEI